MKKKKTKRKPRPQWLIRWWFMRCSYCWRRRVIMLDGKYRGCHKHLGRANIDANRAFHGHTKVK